MSLGRYGLWKCGPKNDIHVSMIVIDIIMDPEKLIKLSLHIFFIVEA